MGLFRKKDEVIDLTKLQKRGVLQRSKEILKSEGNKSLDVVDFSLNKNDSTENAFGFLSNLAGVGDNTIDNLKQEKQIKVGEINELKLKIEDIEYKLDRFLERLDKIEEELKD